jgi:hypothetical protein
MCWMFIKSSTGFETLFEQFALDIKAYQTKFATGKSNYSVIKSTPLLKLENGDYLILSWPFLQSKMYEGLIFDFYQHSGIKEHKAFKTFMDFKNFIGGEVTEKYLFKNLLTACFKSKHQVLNFDDPAIPGIPMPITGKATTSCSSKSKTPISRLALSAPIHTKPSKKPSISNLTTRKKEQVSS